MMVGTTARMKGTTASRMTGGPAGGGRGASAKGTSMKGVR